MATGGSIIIPNERAVQRSIIKLLRVAFPKVFTFAVPNGAVLAGNAGQRARQMGALLGDGLVKGCPDICCLWANGSAMLEVKRPKGSRTSDEQKAIHALLGTLGIPVSIVRSPDEAHAALRAAGAPCCGVLS